MEEKKSWNGKGGKEKEKLGKKEKVGKTIKGKKYEIYYSTRIENVNVRWKWRRPGKERNRKGLRLGKRIV